MNQRKIAMATPISSFDLEKKIEFAQKQVERRKERLETVKGWATRDEQDLVEFDAGTGNFISSLTREDLLRSIERRKEDVVKAERDIKRAEREVAKLEKRRGEAIQFPEGASPTEIKLQMQVEKKKNDKEKHERKTLKLQDAVEKARAELEDARINPLHDRWVGFKEQDLRKAQNNLRRHLEKDLPAAEKALHDAEVKRDQERNLKETRIPILEEFLEGWKQELLGRYRNDYDEIMAWKANGSNPEELPEVSTMVWSYKDDPNWENKLANMLDAEKEGLRRSFILKVTKVVGPMTDVSGLEFGMDGTLNGVVEGEKGRAMVRTEWGSFGWNIQKAHYRLMVRPIL